MKPSFAFSFVALFASAVSLSFSVHSPVVAKSEGGGPKPIKVFRGKGTKTLGPITMDPFWVVRTVSYTGEGVTIKDSSGKKLDRLDEYPTHFDSTIKYELQLYREYKLDSLELVAPFRFSDASYITKGGTFTLEIEIEDPWKVEVYQLPDEIP